MKGRTGHRKETAHNKRNSRTEHCYSMPGVGRQRSCRVTMLQGGVRSCGVSRGTCAVYAIQNYPVQYPKSAFKKQTHD